jgi:hypothetical protein
MPRADGAPYLVPLSFDWEDEALRVAMPTHSPTGRNLAATARTGFDPRMRWPRRTPGSASPAASRLARGERDARRELMRDGRWLV